MIVIFLGGPKAAGKILFPRRSPFSESDFDSVWTVVNEPWSRAPLARLNVQDSVQVQSVYRLMMTNPVDLTLAADLPARKFKLIFKQWVLNNLWAENRGIICLQ